ncbi:MAG: hypothetical protein NUV63_09830 [Gallionella sp.]|nr:hypothetical protein [Gallionella sp.]
MEKFMAILMLRLIGWAGLAFVSVGTALAQPPVNVGVYAEHRGGKVVYHYRVTNNSQDNIAAVWIGHDTKNDGDRSNNAWELLELPSGWLLTASIPPASATSPPGWRVYVIVTEDGESHAIAWNVIDKYSPRLLPSQTFTEMSVMLDKADVNYITGHADILFPDKLQKPTSLTVPIERLDATPPTLTVSLSPSTLWPPNNKLVSVTAAIAVNDDYDPEPEIKLESITASETLADGDIQDAEFAADDQQFSLAAEREGTNLAGRIYTVTYSATDASGNKTTASATATVPHDQGK